MNLNNFLLRTKWIFFQSEIQTESTTEVKFSFLKLMFKSAKDIPKDSKLTNYQVNYVSLYKQFCIRKQINSIRFPLITKSYIRLGPKDLKYYVLSFISNKVLILK
jgi:hypothetical protein